MKWDKTMSKSSLVMEGGAFRGMFTAGVMDVLLENDIQFDAAIGVSAGAVFGCNYKSKQIGRVIRYNKKYLNDKRYCSFHSFFTTGDLFNEKFCYDTLPNELDIFDTKTFKENPMKFIEVNMDCITGKPFYFEMTDGGRRDIKYLQGSASMPLLSKIVKVEGHEFLDGGVSDSIPLEYMESLGYDKNVVILTREKSYVKKKNKISFLARIRYMNRPKIYEAMRNRHLMYERERQHVFSQEEKGNIFLLMPEESIDISPFEKDPEKLQEVYDKGREVALKNLDKLKAYLKRE